MAIEVGTTAPDFTLRDRTEQEVTLSSLRGRPVVLSFYPGAFTGVCTEQFTQVRDRAGDFGAAGAVLVGVSVDSTAVLGAFAQAVGLPDDVLLLADFHPKGEVARAYGVWLEDWGHPTRATVVIDADGVVRHVDLVHPLEVPDQDGLLAAVAACARG
ncbi:MAG: redoxin domain-containing protein [Thermoleophilia bacterium]|jgi:peroxiredoxin|nr:redoxin domain-containing protein [Thermoleophilia bacterium]